jgi:hypothetical protein
MPIPEKEDTVHVVLKWISGKPTEKLPKSPLILVPPLDNTDVKESNVVITGLEIDTMEFVTKMDAISTHTD